jgi:hypothetical protein
VASGSKIIAIQVFSQINSAAQCGGQAKTPCISVQASDLILALQRVYSLRNKYKIAAANMSLGGGVYSSDCDSQFPAEAAAFAQLRGAGIAPVVASGNDGSDTGVSYPSCISTAITVGSSSQGDKQKQVEYVSKFSNMSSLVELMAPGENIRAAVPSGSPCAGGGDPYCTKSGTSSAAPHVAGAIAVMRQANPAATVDGLANALECSGKIVELTGDTSNPRRLAKPRIDMLGAYNWLLKVPTRSWSFQNNAQAFDWTPFNQAWSISAGRYAPQGPYPADYSYAAISSTANCDLSLDVTAAMIRHYPQGQSGDLFPQSGIMLKSVLNYQSRAQSGYFFSYTYFPRVSDPANRGYAAIYRIDNGSFTTLCSKNKGVPVKYNQLNTVRAVSDDSTHTLYLNGKRICSAPNDGVYGPGPVAVLSAFSTLWAPTGGTFDVDLVKITSKQTGASHQTDALAPTVSDATTEGVPPDHPSFAMSAP